MRNLLPLFALCLLLMAGFALAQEPPPSPEEAGPIPVKVEALLEGAVAVLMMVVHVLSEPGWKTTIASFTFWLGLAQAVNVVIVLIKPGGISPEVQEWVSRLIALLMLAFFGRTLSWSQRFKAVFAKAPAKA